jgi:hypothetical protein
MRERGWQLPERAVVIPYFTAAATKGPQRPKPDPLRRLAFFGRIDERKGLMVFAEALRALQPELEVEFVGKAPPRWTPERLRALLPTSVDVVFAGELEQHAALERLRRPGTLVVMPSLQENSPNSVYECLEHGIPFIASAVGGVPELVEPEVLFEPTPGALAAKLRRIIDDGSVPPPARPAFDPDASLERWREVIELRPASRPPARSTEGALQDVLLHAQRATGADVVTCGLRLPGGGLRFFHGDPGALGALENGYGTVALLDGQLTSDDRDLWPLLAGLTASGASIISIPLPLADGRVDEHPDAALRAVQALESVLPDPLRGAARIAAGLAADKETPDEASQAASQPLFRRRRR